MVLLRTIFPALEACQEILVTHRIIKEVTWTNVGEEPHIGILADDVHHGEVTFCYAAISFSDMRDFTSLTAQMSAQEATDLLNYSYECTVPPIEATGGQVLKFMGDGVLAMVRANGQDSAAWPGFVGRATNRCSFLSTSSRSSQIAHLSLAAVTLSKTCRNLLRFLAEAAAPVSRPGPSPSNCAHPTWLQIGQNNASADAACCGDDQGFSSNRPEHGRGIFGRAQYFPRRGRGTPHA